MYFYLKKYIRNLANKSKLIKPIYSFLNFIKVNSTSKMSDEFFAKMKYKENTGKTLNLENPKYFNEKLWWLKINNRNSLMTQCSDKVEVREYLKTIGLEHLLTDIYGVYDKADDIPFNNLQGKYFIKCNHVSGINALYDSLNKSNFDCNSTIKKFNSALKMNYYFQSREWNYKNIKPKILVENFLETTEPLLDFRFFCFHGKVKMIFVDIDTAAEDGTHNPSAKRNIYDREFNLMDFTVGRENFDTSLVNKGEFKHEVRQFQKPYDNQQAEQISLMV
ncbi:ATP-grasp fold amidoligase family protein [Acinetobacter baumannii]|uniref:ATP-grasp fold amidoligase family protein n=1 Tax=Acinetobacter baumannii TaxID=470 RepID=UPI00145C2005|nr:ATP-grasp fold amidoligase family protein [Acinetobacter baumannii]QJH04710.1 carboxylate--amine ligase [Acinetobacter baumannii]